VFVLDCSVTVAWLFDDEDDAYAASVRDRLEDDVAVVPALWSLEVGNALLVAERRRRISRADALRFSQILRTLPIDVDGAPTLLEVEGLCELAREAGLSVYDAAYLELAAAHGLPLASLDKGLNRAAADLGVPLLG
jgi:predicted nucleic acid-binding protein